MYKVKGFYFTKKAEPIVKECKTIIGATAYAKWLYNNNDAITVVEIENTKTNIRERFGLGR